jgi:hypothetical protein
MVDNKNKNDDNVRRKGVELPLLLALLITVLLGLVLANCTKLEVTPPDYQLRLSESKQVQKPFEQTWARAIGWFDANELAIERIDESTGYIEGKLPPATDSPFMDCGAVAARNVVGQPVMTQSGLVRMQVSGRHAARASVTIYMTGTYRLSVFDRYAGREVYRSGPCVSTGALEKRIFAFLDS